MRFGVEPRTVLALAVVLLLAVGFAVQHFWSGRPRSVAAPRVAPAAPVAEGGPKSGRGGARSSAGGPAGGLPSRRVVVDVAGKVREPGVHRLPSGSRVEDALAAAGGPRSGASLRGLNRARVLVDGEQIVVGAPPGAGGPGAVVPGASGPGASAPGAAGLGAGGPAAGGAGGQAGAAGAPGGKVSLGSATAEQLDALPGVGPVLAQRIIEYRTQHGGFASVEDLHKVNGIGERRFADLKPQVTP